MRKASTITFLSIFLPILIFGQTTWNTKIDYEINEHLRVKNALVKTIDGNYLFAYERYGGIPPYFNPFNHALAKYDTDGNLLWEKYYDHNDFFGSGLYPKAITQKVDGRIAVVGQVTGLDPLKAYLYVTNADGDSLLYLTYPSYRDFMMVEEYSQDEIVVYARSQMNNSTSILKVNTTTGNIVEESNSLPYFNINRYIFPPQSDFMYNYDVVSDSIVITKYALSSTILASRKIPPTDIEGFNSSNAGPSGPAMSFLESDDGLIIYNNAVLKLNNNLETTLSIPFNINNLNLNFALDQHTSDVILPTSDGGYLLSGSIRYGLISMLDMEIFFIKLNALGEQEWSKSYPHWELNSNYVPYVIEDTDGYVFIRHYLDGEIYLTKVTETGELVFSKSPVKNPQIEVYPNPCTNYLFIEVPEVFMEGELKVINVTGQVVLKKDKVESPIEQVIVNHLSSGVYFLQIKSKDNHVPPFTSTFSKN